MLLLLCGVALGGGRVAVEEGETREIEGPAVILDEPTFRKYELDVRNLGVCTEALEKKGELLNLSLADGLEAAERALNARRICKAEFDADEALISTQVQTIATQSVTIDDQAVKIHRLKNQRNVAVGVATGFLAAATAAVVLSLD